MKKEKPNWMYLLFKMFGDCFLMFAVFLVLFNIILKSGLTNKELLTLTKEVILSWNTPIAILFICLGWILQDIASYIKKH